MAIKLDRTQLQLVDAPVCIEVTAGKPAHAYRVWLSSGEVIAIECEVSVPLRSIAREYIYGLPDFDGRTPMIDIPRRRLHWRTFWQGGRGMAHGPAGKAALAAARGIFAPVS